MEQTVQYLIGTKVNYTKVNYNDVQNAIEEFYGLREYCLPAEEEIGNDTTMTLNLDGKLDKWELKDAEKLMETKRTESWRTQTYLNYMTSKGLIEPGQYLVVISW